MPTGWPEEDPLARRIRLLQALIERSPRKHALIKLVAQALHNPAIARQLGCSVDNVKKQLQQVFDDTDIHDRTLLAIVYRIISAGRDFDQR
jgi:DNA-binding NarL/FixJ family response regulator